MPERDTTPEPADAAAAQPRNALPAPAETNINFDSGALFVRDRELHRRVCPGLGSGETAA